MCANCLHDLTAWQDHTSGQKEREFTSKQLSSTSANPDRNADLASFNSKDKKKRGMDVLFGGPKAAQQKIYSTVWHQIEGSLSSVRLSGSKPSDRKYGHTWWPNL